MASSVMDTIVKGGVGTIGFAVSAVTLVKFIVATKVKVSEREGEEQDVDLALVCSEEQAGGAQAIDYVIKMVAEQTDLRVARKQRPPKANEPPSKEVILLVSANADVLARIKTRKDKEHQVLAATTSEVQVLSSGERIDLVMYELNRVCALAPTSETTGDDAAEAPDTRVPMPFTEHQPVISSAIQSSVITEMVPLHDDAERAQLIETWVKQWRRAQPLDSIHNYFGDEVGFYFGFLEMYTWWLIAPAAFGLVVLVLDIATTWGPYGRAIYSLFITCWTTAFLKFWKRRECSLRSHWGIPLLDLIVLEQERPDFEGEQRYDPVEEKYYTYFSSIKRMRRYINTSLITLAVLAVIVALMFLYFRLEAWCYSVITKANGWDGNWAHVSIVPSILYSLVVLFLDGKYVDLANSLTKYENHRSDSDFANALVLKLASFYFVNNFGSLFYLAFTARDMDQLQQTLSSLLITRQLIGNVQEQLIPYLTATSSLKAEAGRRAKEISASEAVVSKVEAELLYPTYEGTFDDYLELFVQFGQISLFASAYPLAALWCLLNNIMEIRSDGFKLCASFRRSRRTVCRGIGTWQYAFNALGYLSVITNCAIFGLHSGLMEALFPKASTVLMLVMASCMEHLMLAGKVCIELFVPDVPTSVIDAERARRAAVQKKSQLELEMSARHGHGQLNDRSVSSVISNSDHMSATEMREWITGEKERRRKLEQEVERVNELYMRWIREEQTKRKRAERQLEQLRNSMDKKAE